MLCSIIVARSLRRYSMYIPIRNDTSLTGRFQFSIENE